MPDTLKISPYLLARILSLLRFLSFSKSLNGNVSCNILKACRQLPDNFFQEGVTQAALCYSLVSRDGKDRNCFRILCRCCCKTFFLLLPVSSDALKCQSSSPAASKSMIVWCLQGPGILNLRDRRMVLNRMDETLFYQFEMSACSSLRSSLWMTLIPLILAPALVMIFSTSVASLWKHELMN